MRSESERSAWSRSAAVVAWIACACAPVVRSVAPQRAPVGADVTIVGSNFGASAGDNTVKFAGVAATQLAVPQAGRIVAKVPAGAKTGLVSVTTKDGTGESPTNFVVPTPARWTFMVYLDADNNLEQDGLEDFLEMATVGSSSSVNIVVQIDRRPGFATGYGDWADTRRFLVGKGDTPAVAPLQNLGEVNMGDPARLQGFVEWAVTDYPAEHYMLVIWNHGGGWRVMQDLLLARAARPEIRATEGGAARAVAWDDSDNDVLFMREVQQALEGARANVARRTGTSVKLDVVGFDACLMGMVEVSYALRNVAGYVVGSENYEPGAGWPYDKILADLAGNPEMTGRDLASIVVTRYQASYPSGSGITQSAVDLSRITDLVARIDGFAATAQSEWAQLAAARAATRQYHIAGRPDHWGVDLRTFAAEVQARATGADLKAAAVALRDAADAFVVNEMHSPDMAGSAGVAIYFPATKAILAADPDGPGYDDANTVQPVQFVAQHQWDNWLKTYHQHVP